MLAAMRGSPQGSDLIPKELPSPPSSPSIPPDLRKGAQGGGNAAPAGDATSPHSELQSILPPPTALQALTPNGGASNGRVHGPAAAEAVAAAAEAAAPTETD